MEVHRLADGCYPEDIVRVYVGRSVPSSRYHINISGDDCDDADCQICHGYERFFDVPSPLLKYVCKVFADKIEDARSAQLHDPTQADKLLQVHLRDDDSGAFGMLLHWAFLRKMPPLTSDGCLIRAWILGNKYGIAGFLEVVMLNLLKRPIEDRFLTFSAELIYEAVKKTAPGSKMRRLMAEEVVCKDRTKGEHTASLLMKLAKHGFVEEVNAAHDQYDVLGPGMFDRFPSSERPFNDDWRDFMVDGKGPGRVNLVYEEGELHWVGTEEGANKSVRAIAA